MDAVYDTILICSKFFGYYLDIMSALNLRSRSVLWIDDRPGEDVWTKILIRISPTLLSDQSERFFLSNTKQIDPRFVRDILVIKGEALSPSTLKMLKGKFKTAKVTIYFWDSYRNMPGAARDNVGIADAAFSFDLDDTDADKRLVYQPLFHSAIFEQHRNFPISRDLLFVGTAYGDRVRVLQRVKMAVRSNITMKTHLYARYLAIARLRTVLDSRFWGAKWNDFTDVSLKRSEVAMLMGESKAVLDVERPIQTGFAPRAIEVLVGVNRKLVTTNANIKRADFYNESNVHIINRKRPFVSLEFLDRPFVSIPDSIAAKYTVGAWLDALGLN